MKKFSWRTYSLMAFGLAIGVATVSFADHSWGGYHWARTSNPFTLKVGNNVSSAWDPYLDEAIADWNASGVLHLSKVAGGTQTSSVQANGGANGGLQRALWQYRVARHRADLDQWHRTSPRRTTKLNDTYFNTSTYNKPAWRRLVTCQEIAHDFGLDHQDEDFDNPNLGTCMDYTSNPESANQHPNQHDYDELEAIYAHLDSTSTIGASLPKNMPPAMGQIDFDTPGQWGKLVRSSANGRVEVFEQDFGRGHKVVTHVFWADPDRDRE